MQLYTLPYSVCTAAILLIASLLPSCHDHRNDVIRASLAHIDTLMFSDPDSALRVLNHLPDTITDRETAAWRDLLTVKTLDKAYHPLPSDSLLANTAAYYTDRGDSLETQSLYYYGSKLMSDNQNDTALVVLYKSFSLAKYKNDYRYAAFSAQAIGDIYANLSIIVEEIEWTKKAYEYFDYANMPLHAAIARLTNINAQIYTDSIDKAESLFMQINPYLFKSNKYFSDYYTSLKFDIEYLQKRYEKALDIIHEMPEDELKLNSNKWCKIAECHLRMKNLTKCLECLDSAKKHIKTAMDETFYKRSMSLALYENNEYQKAFLYSNDWGNEISRSDLNLINHPGTRQLMNHYRLEYEIQRLNNKIEKRNTIIYFCFSTFLCMTLIIIAWYILYKNRAKYARLELSYASLYEDFKATNNGILADVNTKIMNMFSDDFKSINELIGKGIKVSKSISNLDNAIHIKIDRIFNELTSDAKIAQIESIINSCDKNWMAEFRIEYPKLPKDDYRLAIYSYLGFGKDTIAFLLNLENNNQVRSRRYNLKARLLKENSPKQSYFFQKLGFKDND